MEAQFDNLAIGTAFSTISGSYIKVGAYDAKRTEAHMATSPHTYRLWGATVKIAEPKVKSVLNLRPVVITV